jgi:hypothetical protein
MTTASARAHHHEEERFAFRARRTAFGFGFDRVAVAVVLRLDDVEPDDPEPEDGLSEDDLSEVGRVPLFIDLGMVLAPPDLRFLATEMERTRQVRRFPASCSAGSQVPPGRRR